jgi:hypothetical protein
MAEDNSPIRNTRTFAHSRTTFPGAKETEQIAELVEFCKESMIPGKVVIVLPGNGGVTSVTFESKEHPIAIVELPEEDVDNP